MKKQSLFPLVSMTINCRRGPLRLKSVISQDVKGEKYERGIFY
jgi:hypothetical protein